MSCYPKGMYSCMHPLCPDCNKSSRRDAEVEAAKVEQAADDKLEGILDTNRMFLELTEKNEKLLSRLEELETENAKIKSMGQVDKSFHDLAVNERNLARYQVMQLKARNDALGARNATLEKAVTMMLPAIEEAFWDHHSAGCIPGAGYHHRVYTKLPFSWRQEKEFLAWVKTLSVGKTAPPESPVVTTEAFQKDPKLVFELAATHGTVTLVDERNEIRGYISIPGGDDT